ncbi:MAG: bifunctional hydroxymethylpyrimidine kinase/phosphomethylpyrimidine kinase [Aquificota bacterium]|nr:MAG: bifunctional hydroxymethylpyrimidine kinase/phosphomethylpyrimidine kinase [Aquificota bacterium]
MFKVLTIAGSDNSGGAGIQADLKVFTALNVYGMAVITSLTAQNTTGVKDIYPVNGDFVFKQIETIAGDIGLDSVKTGMLLTIDVVEAVSVAVKQFKMKNLVVDTVFKSKNGKDLLSENAIDVYIKKLLPEALVITPNIPEAEIISGLEIKTLDDMKKAAKEIQKINKGYVVLKGGHLVQDGETVDIVYDGKDFIELRFPYVKTKNTHGTGCTYSAAIAAYLAKTKKPLKSIKLAKAYLHGAIENSLNIGKGHGPLNHNWLISCSY